jgi:hypothetical protein
VHEIAPVCQVDDAVGVGRRFLDDVQVVEVAVADVGAGGLQLLRRRIGAGQGDHLVSGALQLGNERGADVAGSAGDEYAHCGYLQI